VKSKIEIINTSKFIKLADFVFSAVVSEEDFNEKFKSNSLIIQKTELKSSNFIWFVVNNLKIKDNDVIFCHVELLKNLFSLLNSTNLKNLTLISAQSDKNINQKIFSKKPESIERWFSTNVIYKHESLYPIPLGVNNDFYSINLIEQDFKNFTFKQKEEKSNSIYSSFNVNTRFLHRHYAMKNAIKSKKVSFNQHKKNKKQYLKQLNEHKYILSPWGNGVDTHRIWEALYANCIPIVKDHVVFSSFRSLPIKFVKNYKNLDSNLNQSINDSEYLEIADFKYWESLILDSNSKDQEFDQNIFTKNIEKLTSSFLKKRAVIIKFLVIKKKIKYFFYRLFKKIF